MGRILLALALLALAGPSAGAAAVVDAVVLRSSVPTDEASTLMELLVVQPGEPLSEDAVRRSLRNLQASGVVRTAHAYVGPVSPAGSDSDAGGRVQVTFEVALKLQVRSVRLAGDVCLKESPLRAVLEQRARSTLSESRMLRGVYRLRDLLAERGYPEAAVRLEVAVDDATQQADVVYHLTCREPQRVASIAVAGELAGLEASELEALLRLKVGDRLVRGRLPQEAERLERWLIKRGYLAASVGQPSVSEPGEAGPVALSFPVTVGPVFRIRFSGFDADLLRRRGLLDALESEHFDEALLLQTVNRIRDDFQRRGHYRVRVEAEQTEAGHERLLDLTIEPGPVFTLTSLDLEGNEVLTTRSLEARMATTLSRAFFRGSGRLVDSELEEDLRNLRAYYALEGFFEAEVGTAVVEEAGDELRVAISIQEGRRRRVVSVTYPGLEALTPAAGSLPIEAGGPFHQRRVEDAAAELRARLEEAGYLSAQVSSEVRWDDSGLLADVEFGVLEGPQATVDRVVIRGNRRVRADVLRRSIDLAGGEPVNRRRLLTVQRDLYRLGVFSNVVVRLAPSMPFATERDVLVEVVEGRAQKGSFGVGYDSEDGVRTLLGYSHGNLFGRAVAARLDLRFSEREQQARFLVRQPFVGRVRLPVTYSLFTVVEEQESFTSDRRGLQINGEYERGSSRYGLLLTAKQVEVEDPDPALKALEIDRRLRDVDILSLTPRWFVDRRNDPLVPTTGWSSSLQLEYAFPWVGATAQFAKAFGQVTGYVPLGRAGVLASSFRLGGIEPGGDVPAVDSTVPDGLTSAAVPISERFFAGGRSTHRAYRRDLLGVEGETLLTVVDEDGTERRVPIGGNGLVLANLDYRFPIAGALGGTVFVDAGNVFGDWDGLDLDALQVGAGVGLRFLSPVGPLRLEVGWPLDDDFADSPVIFLSFGNPF